MIVHGGRGLANRQGVEEIVGRMDIQGQVNGAVATRDHALGLQILGQDARCCRRDMESILIISFTQTDVCCNVRHVHRVDHEGQTDDAVATGSRVEIVGVFATFSQVLTSEFVRQLVAANHHRALKIITGQYGEVQRVVAVASVHCGEGHLHNAVSYRGKIDGGSMVLKRGGGLAKRHLFGEMIDRIHGQDEMDGAVATKFGRDDAVGVDDTCRARSDGEVRIRIGFAQADRGRAFRGVHIVDVQVQNHCAVAAIGCMHAANGVNACGAFIETILVINTALANVRMEDGLILVGHSKVQCNHAVATVHGAQGVIVNACIGQDSAIEIVCGGFANGLVDSSAINRIDGQRQCGGAVATMYVAVVMDQSAGAGCHKCCVETMADIMFLGANSIVVGDVVAVTHVQVHGHGAVATIDGLEMLYIVTGSGVGLTVPCLAVASCCMEFGCGGVMDGQMQRHGAVATVDSLEMLHIVAGNAVGLVIPSIAVACGDVEFRGDRVMHGQSQRHGAVATVGRGDGLHMFTRGSVGLSVPNVAVAGFVREGKRFQLLYMQGQGHGAVAAIRGLCAEGAGEVTGGGEGLLNAMIVVGRSLTDGVVQDLRFIDGEDGESDSGAPVAFANNVAIIHHMGKEVLCGGIQQRCGVFCDACNRLAAFGAGIPLVCAFARCGDSERARTAMGLSCQLRQARDGMDGGGHRLTLASAVGVFVETLHIIGGGAADRCVKVCARVLHRCSGTVVQIPTTGGGIVIDSGVKGDRSAAATNLVCHNRYGRIRVYGGHDRHADRGATCFVIGQLNIISMGFI